MEENIIQIKSGITISVDLSVKKHHICESVYIWNLATCSCKNGEYLTGIIESDSVITCDEIIAETKTIPIKFYEKKQPVKHKILLPFF